MGDVVGVHVGVGGADHSHDATAVDGVGGVDEVGATGFDFDKDDAVVFHGDDVDFHVSGVPVALDDGIAFGDEQVDGELFAPFSQIVVNGHKAKKGVMSCRSKSSH